MNACTLAVHFFCKEEVYLGVFMGNTEAFIKR